MTTAATTITTPATGVHGFDLRRSGTKKQENGTYLAHVRCAVCGGEWVATGDKMRATADEVMSTAVAYHRSQA